MADNNTPTAPAAPVQPAAPSPSPAPTVTIPTVPAVAPRQAVSAKKALGLEATPRKLMNLELERNKANLPQNVTPYTPPAAPKKEEDDDATPKPAAPAAEPAKPADTTPAKPAAAAAPAAPEKVTIDGKEYTVEELKGLLKGKDTSPTTPAPAAPAKPAEAAPVASPAPSKEEIAAAETGWRQEFLKSSGVNFAPTADEMETLLSGGEEAVKLFATKQGELFSHAVLAARKSIFDDINTHVLPQINELGQALAPLLQNHVSLQRYQVKQEFLQAHPKLADQSAVAEQIAEKLLEQYPEQVSKLSRADFLTEVARQTTMWLDSQAKVDGFASWEEKKTALESYRKSQTPPAAPGAAPASPAATTPPATTPAPSAAPAPAPTPQPPAANAPAAAPSAAGSNFHKSVAASLRG